MRCKRQPGERKKKKKTEHCVAVRVCGGSSEIPPTYRIFCTEQGYSCCERSQKVSWPTPPCVWDALRLFCSRRASPLLALIRPRASISISKTASPHPCALPPAICSPSAHGTVSQDSGGERPDTHTHSHTKSINIAVASMTHRHTHTSEIATK